MYVCMYVRITIENKPINCVSSSSCLGVKLDNKLNWSPHIKMVNWNFHAKISKLKQMKTFNWSTLENFYFKGNLPSVTYCISLWRSFNLPDGFTTSTYVSQSMKFSAWQNGVKEKLRFDVKCSKSKALHDFFIHRTSIVWNCFSSQLKSKSRLALRNSLNTLTILISPQTLLQPVIAVTNLCIIDL